ncbi:MAG: serine O-acetyltransferase [Clostridia bacterium]|nr:serine O-acetyltransferase [Clostridia bacterium]
MGLIRDAKSIARRDPAARNALEVFFLYPGYHALIYHKVARGFYKIKLKFIARWLSQLCTRRTGIEIHPGATIGHELFIDHGVGVVIGETAVIGDNCTIYHQVTLGGTGHVKHCKRHPTVGNNVLIGAGAKILGPVTVGDNAMIGAGSVVVEDVPANTTVTGVKARVVRVNGEKLAPSIALEQRVGDPFAVELTALKKRVEELTARLNALDPNANTDAAGGAPAQAENSNSEEAES